MLKKLTPQGPKGRQSYTVTLPKEWVVENSLDKTKEVDLRIVGSKLILSTIRSDKELLVSGEDYGRSIHRIIPAIYRKGVKKITLKDFDPKLIDEIYEILQKQLIGFEITEHTKEKIVIEYLMEESEQSLASTLRRIFLLMIEYFSLDEKTQVKNMEKNIQRLLNHCQRIILKKGYEDYKNLPEYYLLLDRLDKITDELSELLVLKLNSDQKEKLKKIKIIFEKAYELYYKFEESKFDEFSEKSYRMFKSFKKSENKNTASVHLYNICRTSSALYSTILSLKIK